MYVARVFRVFGYPGAHTTSDFKHYFKQIYKSSTTSGKAFKSLTSKLQSVGSTLSEPQSTSPDDPYERVFKAHVAYDVSHSILYDTFG